MPGAFHEDFSVEAAPARGSDRTFGLLLAAVAAAFALVPWLQGREPRTLLLAGAAALAALAFALPRALAPLRRVLRRFGDLLRAVTTPIALAAVYFLVLTPIALLARVLSRPRLPMRPDSGVESYWSERRPEDPPRVAMRRPF